MLILFFFVSILFMRSVKLTYSNIYDSVRGKFLERGCQLLRFGGVLGVQRQHVEVKLLRAFSAIYILYLLFGWTVCISC